MASTSGSSERDTTSPPTSAASSAARSAVRLATSTRSAPALRRAMAMARPIAPAPSSTRCGRRRCRGARPAISTAACDTDAVPRAMPVSVRARLPVSTAWRNSRLRVGPTVPSSTPAAQAAFTWPRTSVSPRTSESTPAATRKRWRDRVDVVVDVEVVGEVVRGDVGQVGEDVADLLVGGVEPLGHQVDLGAVARRHQDGLGDVVAAHHGGEGLGQAGTVEGQPLEQVEGHRPMVETDDDDRHASFSSLRGGRGAPVRGFGRKHPPPRRPPPTRSVVATSRRQTPAGR